MIEVIKRRNLLYLAGTKYFKRWIDNHRFKEILINPVKTQIPIYKESSLWKIENLATVAIE